MYYYIKAKTGNKDRGYYTGSGVSKIKTDAQQYTTKQLVRAAYRALKGTSITPLTIGHAL
jgi:hypothetical protein